MSKNKILGDKYKIEDRIAEGGFSTVYYCRDRATGDRYAVKVLRKQKVSTLNMEEAFEREASALRALHYSPYVTNVIDILQSTRNYYVVMDLADCGTLLSLIVKGNLSQMAARKYFRQLLMGLQSIHNSNVVHRDIKPENLLLDEWRDLRISDFGFAACSRPDRILTRQCGTPNFVAPEVITGNGYKGREIDIWSAGVTLYVMLYRQLPFVGATTDKVFDQIKTGKYATPASPNVSLAAIHLLSVMLQVDPAKRWPLERILSHPWVLGRNNVPSTWLKRPKVQLQPSIALSSNLAAVPAGKDPLGTSPLNGLAASLHASLPENDQNILTFSPTSNGEQTPSLLNIVGQTSVMSGADPSSDTMFVSTSSLADDERTLLSNMFGQYARAPSMSCPDFRSLFQQDLDFGSRKQNARRISRGTTPLDAERSTNNDSIPRMRRHSLSAASNGSDSRGDTPGNNAMRDVETPGLTSLGGPVDSGTSPGAGARQSPATANAPEDKDRFQRGWSRRLGLIHIQIALNFLGVCIVVLVVGAMRVLFDVDISRVPMPRSIRVAIEAILTPPSTATSTNSSTPSNKTPTTPSLNSTMSTPRLRRNRSKSRMSDLDLDSMDQGVVSDGESYGNGKMSPRDVAPRGMLKKKLQ